MIRRLIILLLIVGCEDNSLNDTSKNTYYDDIADITYLNGSFFTTNYDLSNNAGSQLDLIKFKYENDSSAYLDNSYDLNMNGQGYLAIANNGLDLFLQSRESHLLIKCSVTGELANMTMDTIDTNWQPCGLTFNNDNDSIITLYRNLDTLSKYRAITIAQDLSFSTSSDITFNLDFIDTIPDTTVVGLSFKENDLFLSYRNRRIEKWKTY